MESPRQLAAGVLLINRRGEVLLQLRDDIPTIRYPNVWGLVGGHVEPGETVEEALVRETEEEVGETIASYDYFDAFESAYEGVVLDVHVYAAPLDAPAESLTITEGQRVEYFSPEAVMRLDLVPWLRRMLPNFFASPLYAAYTKRSA
jgi:8-oxo-dGTP diphosphatase